MDLLAEVRSETLNLRLYTTLHVANIFQVMKSRYQNAKLTAKKNDTAQVESQQDVKATIRHKGSAQSFTEQ